MYIVRCACVDYTVPGAAGGTKGTSAKEGVCDDDELAGYIIFLDVGIRAL